MFKPRVDESAEGLERRLERNGGLMLDLFVCVQCAIMFIFLLYEMRADSFLLLK